MFMVICSIGGLKKKYTRSGSGSSVEKIILKSLEEFGPHIAWVCGRPICVMRRRDKGGASELERDKSISLRQTTEYISSLKSQVEELSKRNLELQSELSTTARKEGGGEEVGGLSSSSERVSVEIAQVSSASTSEEARFLDLRVRIRSGECSLLDLVVRVLEFLNQQSNLRLLSVQSNTRLVESAPVHGLVLRLRVEGDDLRSVVSKKL
ncbi:hypothetical protein Sango_1958400 [Sesamum angolense]|uniref:DUF7049 domain-containing protein n=1 Tax=Sesamum angolense TaxID=2727404 RepID=A0AAE2BND0_9LAMI|nr:hypothetical protein Sango_1958400 [Sesamum angolense]